jgi:SpoVK/Ycf46/Vps4 family AAA+-type ATPase
MNIRLRYSSIVASLLLGANLFAMKENNSNKSEVLSQEDIQQLEQLNKKRKLDISSPQNSSEYLASDIRFFGEKPEGFQDFIKALNNPSKSQKILALGISGGSKSGKTLLVKSELVRELSSSIPCHLCSVSGSDFVQAKGTKGLSFDKAVENLTCNHPAVKAFMGSDAKFLVYYIKRLHNILPPNSNHLSEDEQDILLNNLDAMADPDNFDREKRIVIVASSLRPILKTLYRGPGSSRTLVSSIVIKPTDTKNRIAMWSGYFDAIAPEHKGNVDIDLLANKTQGFTGYDINQVLENCVEKFEDETSKKQKTDSTAKLDLTSLVMSQVKSHMQEALPQVYKEIYPETPSPFI